METKTRQEALNRQLKAALLRLLPEAGLLTTAVPQLRISRYNGSRQLPGCLGPRWGVIVQDAKKGMIGADSCSYKEGQCLASGVDVPSSFQILETAKQRPFSPLALISIWR